MEMIRQIIETRTAKIFDGVFEDDGGIRYKEFMKNIQLVPKIPDDILMNLEEIFLNHTRELIDYCYDLGFKDGMQVNGNKNVELSIMSVSKSTESEKKNLA